MLKSANPVVNTASKLRKILASDLGLRTAMGTGAFLATTPISEAASGGKAPRRPSASNVLAGLTGFLAGPRAYRSTSVPKAMSAASLIAAPGITRGLSYRVFGKSPSELPAAAKEHGNTLGMLYGGAQALAKDLENQRPLDAFSKATGKAIVDHAKSELGRNKDSIKSFMKDVLVPAAQDSAGALGASGLGALGGYAVANLLSKRPKHDKKFVNRRVTNLDDLDFYFQERDRAKRNSKAIRALGGVGGSVGAIALYRHLKNKGRL